MNTLPHRFLHTLTPNAALLALVIAAHALLGWWLWINNQASISPPKPLNTVEVLLLPATPNPPIAPSAPSAQQPKPTAQARPKVNPTSPKVTSRQQAAPTATPSRTQETPSPLPAPTTLPTTAPLAETSTPSGPPDKAANNTDNSSSSNSSSKSSTASSNASSTNSTTSAPTFGAAYLNNPNPVYPAVSRQLNEQGRVLLRVHVGADGLVMDLDIKSSSGFARLDKSARDAVQRWRFVPAQQNGQAIAAWVVVPISFFLKG